MPALSACPGSRTSSPVDNSAARKRLKTSSRSWPRAAARPRSAGLRRRPAAKETAPFVAGRQQRGAQATEAQQPVLAESGRKPEIGRLEPPPGSQGDRAFRNIPARVAASGAPSYAGRDSHSPVFNGAILLHQNGIETLGHGRAGEDADRFATACGTAERMAGGGAPGHRQYRLAMGREIGMRDGVAIDSAVGMRRD